MTSLFPEVDSSGDASLFGGLLFDTTGLLLCTTGVASSVYKKMDASTPLRVFWSLQAAENPLLRNTVADVRCNNSVAAQPGQNAQTQVCSVSALPLLSQLMRPMATDSEEIH